MGDGPCDGLDGWAMGTWPWTWTCSGHAPSSMGLAPNRRVCGA